MSLDEDSVVDPVEQWWKRRHAPRNEGNVAEKRQRLNEIKARRETMLHDLMNNFLALIDSQEPREQKEMVIQQIQQRIQQFLVCDHEYLVQLQFVGAPQSDPRHWDMDTWDEEIDRLDWVSPFSWRKDDVDEQTELQIMKDRRMRVWKIMERARLFDPPQLSSNDLAEFKEMMRPFFVSLEEFVFWHLIQIAAGIGLTLPVMGDEEYWQDLNRRMEQEINRTRLHEMDRDIVSFEQSVQQLSQRVSEISRETPQEFEVDSESVLDATDTVVKDAVHLFRLVAHKFGLQKKERIGQGVYGYVYDVGDNKVIKFECVYPNLRSTDFSQWDKLFSSTRAKRDNHLFQSFMQYKYHAFCAMHDKAPKIHWVTGVPVRFRLQKTTVTANVFACCMDKISTLSDVLTQDTLHMEKLRPLFQQDIPDLIRWLRSHDLTHGDMHLSNIGLVAHKNGWSVRLLDFGRASQRANPVHDAAMIILSLCRMIWPEEEDKKASMSPQAHQVCLLLNDFCSAIAEDRYLDQQMQRNLKLIITVIEQGQFYQFYDIVRKTADYFLKLCYRYLDEKERDLDRYFREHESVQRPKQYSDTELWELLRWSFTWYPERAWLPENQAATEQTRQHRSKLFSSLKNPPKYWR